MKTNQLENKVERDQGRRKDKAEISYLIGGGLIVLLSGLAYLFFSHEKPEHRVPLLGCSILGVYMMCNYSYQKYKEYKNEKLKNFQFFSHINFYKCRKK